MDSAGRLHRGLPEYDGLTVFKANEPIVALLARRGALMARQEIVHSYPHCWRCHRPVIFRATEQWFISMDTPMPDHDGQAKGATFRAHALEAIRTVKWDPAWGEERITNMVASRPDWCISRQRIWGVPIAVFLCLKCNRPLNQPAINRRIIDLFAAEGADAWYIRDIAEILPPGTQCPSCDNGTPPDAPAAWCRLRGFSKRLAAFQKEMDHPRCVVRKRRQPGRGAGS